MIPSQSGRWRFWVDRGGTFTDIIGLSPDHTLYPLKLLSSNPKRYVDPIPFGIRKILNYPADLPLNGSLIEELRLGTTIATNALLEKQGAPTLFVTTQGFGDLLEIGDQTRPDLFSLHIEKATPLYTGVIEAHERVSANGTILESLQENEITHSLKTWFDQGIRSIAVALLHSIKNPIHEERIGKIAQKIGFTHCSLSHQISTAQELLARAELSLIDAYLSPPLYSALRALQNQLPGVEINCIRSDGSLCKWEHFRGKDAVLSGPAGGVIGVENVGKRVQINQLIAFDMGGTSTDVARCDEHPSRTEERVIAGQRLRTPMVSVHTVAAGGGSLIQFDGVRLSVGPESAGADPGPSSYGKGGPLTLTDAHVILGRLPVELIPARMGHSGQDHLSISAAKVAFNSLFKDLTRQGHQLRSIYELAWGAITLAVTEMAEAIKDVSIKEGVSLDHYTLCSFGGAAGQHACLIAEQLGIKQVISPSLSGVLSAYGIGLAKEKIYRNISLNCSIDTNGLIQLKQVSDQLIQSIHKEVSPLPETFEILIAVRFGESDATFELSLYPAESCVERLIQAHVNQFGFTPHSSDLRCIRMIVSCEVTSHCYRHEVSRIDHNYHNHAIHQSIISNCYMQGHWIETQCILRNQMEVGKVVSGPAIIVDEGTTVVVELGWSGELNHQGDVLLYRQDPLPVHSPYHKLSSLFNREVFQYQLMGIATQMGFTLQRTARSVNMRERLDFSCAIFTKTGQLIANAPHVPVHLGSMSESVQTIINRRAHDWKSGDSFLINSPYSGGTHLPDITVITPIFDDTQHVLIGIVASRGHHAELGGITPGSMPAHSSCIEDEGILFEDRLIVRDGQLDELGLLMELGGGTYPSRNPELNIADLRAQLAANERGRHALLSLYNTMGAISFYQQQKQLLSLSETLIRSLVRTLPVGRSVIHLDQGGRISLEITTNQSTGEATFDFTGTSLQRKDNLNAPKVICKAAILFVLRTLLNKHLPLNDGCLQSITLIIPEGSLLSPSPPAAVAAGNVEISQLVVSAIYRALGICADSQGTMNNLTLGNETFQYYETLCGGAGATQGFDGANAVHTHMTNTRLTDPEILEARYPIRILKFRINRASGGKGRWSGGDGVERQLIALTDMSASFISQRRIYPPQGISGGMNGKAGQQSLIDSTGERTQLKGIFTIHLNQGDSLAIFTPGGGGYGSGEKDLEVKTSQIRNNA